MYRVISFYFMDGKYYGKTDKGPEFCTMDIAKDVAYTLNASEAEKSPVVRSIFHGVHIPVTVISEKEFIANKWDQFIKYGLIALY